MEKIKCDSCYHKDICKYKELYSKLFTDVSNCEIKEVSEIFSIEIKCRNYCSKMDIAFKELGI